MKLMILGASILQVPAIEKAIEMGIDVVAVDMDPNAVGFKIPGITKEVISTIDIPAVIEAARRNHIDGVMTLASDMPMRTVSAVAREFGLVGVTDETAFNTTNKAAMREALQKNGVPIPKFQKVGSLAEYWKAVRGFTSAFVVKPADNSGSRGIVLVENQENKTLLEEAYNYSRKFSRSGDVVVEEYMRGPEVSVETLSVDGVCHVIQITDKLTTGAPHFVEMGHSQPTRLGFDTAERIRGVVKAANKAVGITAGPSHTEVIITDEGPKIVELGARLGGDCITTHLVPMSTGVDMVENCIRIALGEAPDLEAKQYRGAAIRYIPQHAGVIQRINGVETAKQMPGVKQVSIVHAEGKHITDVTDSASRMGFVIAQGADVQEAVKNCEQALMEIHIEYEI